jgi:hypothetical protein
MSNFINKNGGVNVVFVNNLKFDDISPKAAKTEKEAMKELEKFISEKVKLEYSMSRDLLSKQDFKIGRIEKHPEDNRYIFFEGRKRKKFYNLTLGLFDGFVSTLTIKKIEVV